MRRKATTLLSMSVLAGLVIAGSAAASTLSQLLDEGDRLCQERRYDDARRAYEEAIKVDPSSPEAHNQLGICLSKMGRKEDAIAEYRQAVQLKPDFGPSLRNLGSALYQQKQFDQAIEIYTRVTELRPNDPEGWTNLANVLRDKGTETKNDQVSAQAIEYYEKAIKLDSTFAQAHNNLGLAYLRQGKFDQAEREIKKAIAQRRDYADAYFNLGLINEYRNNIPAAVQAFQKSLQYEQIPEYKNSTQERIRRLGVAQAIVDHFDQGYEALLAKNYSKAEREFKQALKAESNNPIIWNNLGYSQAQQGKYGDAVDSYKKATSLLGHRFPAAHYNLGQALRMSGDLNGAQAELEKAIATSNKKHALAYNALGMVLKQKGDVKGAIERYRIAILQSGDTLPIVYYNLGLAKEKIGDQKGAIEAFSNYLDAAPKGVNAERAKERVARLKLITR